MRIIVSSSNDPYFNLAAEEFLLRNFTEDTLFLYVNSPVVVVGKHQNLLSEINYRFIFENKILLARRITGGGTVYHDQGNLNYAFFSSASLGTQINFPKYLNWVLLALKQLKIDAVFEGKNNLRVEGFKISGNAGHVFKNITLHHGTLLVSANLQLLSEALKVDENLYTDKAVKSIRAKVANLTQFNPNITIQNVIDAFCNIFNQSPTFFSLDETRDIEKLKFDKFCQPQWIWGYSPPYTFYRNATPWGSIRLIVEKGIIVEAHVSQKPDWNQLLTGLSHNYPTLLSFFAPKGIPANEIWWFF